MASDSFDASPNADASLTFHRLGVADLKAALGEGWRDFRAAPTHLYFLALIYPVAVLIGAWAAFDYDLAPLVFPIVSGGALLGPFAAVALYRVSRRLDRGDAPTAWDAPNLTRTSSAPTIAILGAILMAIFVAWLFTAFLIYNATLGGLALETPGAFLRALFSTPQGWTLVLVGNLVGLAFAAVVLAGSVVSFPLAIDRPVGPMTAIAASLKVTARNTGTIAAWGLIIALMLAATSVTLFVGLAVVLPVLGHASWRLYRRAVG